MAVAYRVITHIHSSGSNAQASPGSRVVNEWLDRMLGAVRAEVAWFECDTSVADLEAILAGKRTRRPVDLLFLTDHLSPAHHHIDEAVFELGRRCHRFGVGAEIQTCLPAAGGTWALGHDVLLYGQAGLRPGPTGGYYGLTQEIIDEIFDVCIPDGAPLPETMRLRAFCRERGIACALAHPLDGHALTVKQIVTVLATFDFVETLNGGYPEANARALERLCAALRREQHAGLARSGALAHPGSAAERPAALIGLGGGDAHLRDFDRVVTEFRHDGGPPDAGDFVSAMLSARTDPDAARRLFMPSGRGMTSSRLIAEAITIGLRNVARARHRLDRRLVAAIVVSGSKIAVTEVRSKYRAARDQRAQLAEWLSERSEPRSLAREAVDSPSRSC